MSLFIHDEDPTLFPDPYEHNIDGLVFFTPTLDHNRMKEGVKRGFFPWSDYKTPIVAWYCPLERFVIFVDKIHISHSMRNIINKNRYRVTFDEDFHSVIQHCSQMSCGEKRVGRGSWLGGKFYNAYLRLNEMGITHSIEVWDGTTLVGGLFGEIVNHCFIGESMFSDAPSASKLALIYLAQKMQNEGGILIDCQIETPHLKSMGGETIAYADYLKHINTL